MRIGLNSVVEIEYTLRDEEGETIDASGSEDLLTYLHGHGSLVPGVERALEGKTAGDALRFTVTPADGYGEYDEEAVQVVSKSEFPPDTDLTEGLEFFVEDPQGNPRPVSILAIEGDAVSLDFNHPLAGVPLDFEITIRTVRDATAEELAHGHVHGAGGEHHHD